MLPNFTEYVEKLRRYRGLSPELQSKISTKYRNIITLNGYDFDTAKSALQKYIRRSNVKKAQYIACELDLFRFFPNGKACWTNFYNRLRVIALEDIGLACTEILPVIDNLFDRWIKDENNLSVNMLKAVKIMCICPHSRFYSHLRAYTKTAKPNMHKPNYLHPLGRDEKLRESVDNLVWCMENKDVHAWYWIEKILAEEKLCEKRRSSTRPGFLIFDIVRYFTDQIATDICEKWYKTLKVREQFLCCIHPVYAYIAQNGEENYSVSTTELRIIFKNIQQNLKPYNRVLTNQTIEIDDYVYDMHTRFGRTLKKDTADFAVEGSLVAYENTSICGKDLNQLFARKYTQEKIRQGSVSLESDEFVLKARAQLICSAARPDSYFAKNRIGQNVVVKGPYLDREGALMPFKIQSVLRLFRGVNSIDTNVKILLPDMFDGMNNPETPLGCRTKIEKEKAYYFVVMEDLMNKEKYPTVEKESKIWPKTVVIDYENLFKDEGKRIGFGVPSEMSDSALMSYLLQISIRYALQIGDFACRNFLRVEDKVYNLDTENIGVGNSIRFSKKETDILRKYLGENREEYEKYLRSWLQDELAWHIVEITLDNTDARKNVKSLLENPEKLFAK
jgi:hypothetical protein